MQRCTQVARCCIGVGGEHAHRPDVGGIRKAELTDGAARWIEQNPRDQTRIFLQPSERRCNPGFGYCRIGHRSPLAAVIMSSLTRPRLASGVTIVTSTTSRAPTTQM